MTSRIATSTSPASCSLSTSTAFIAEPPVADSKKHSQSPAESLIFAPPQVLTKHRIEQQYVSLRDVLWELPYTRI